MKLNRHLCLFALLTFSVALSGCGSNPVWKRQMFAFALPGDQPAPPSRTNFVELTRVTISPLFQSQSFTYRTGENAYVQDAYASFIVPPDRALTEAIRAWMRKGGSFGHVIEPGSGLAPSIVAEASVNELDGDFRAPDKPVGAMAIRFIVYEINSEGPNRLLMDNSFARQTPLERHTPAALATAWDTDLREIMEQLNSEFSNSKPK